MTSEPTHRGCRERTARLVECGEFSPLSAADLSPSKFGGHRLGPASHGWREHGRLLLENAHLALTATSRLRKAVTSHRTP